MTWYFELPTDEGIIGICEADLPLTDDDLRRCGLTRKEFDRLFKWARRLMRCCTTPGERVRPCADRTLDGEWFVLLIPYSPATDPLMQVRRPKGLQAKN